MSSSNFLVDEPLGTFLEHARGAYQESVETFFDKVDADVQRRHKFRALACEQITGGGEYFPMWFSEYEDTAGKVHRAVTFKGLWEGGHENAPAYGTAFQIWGAFCRQIGLESTMVSDRVKKVIDRWIEECPPGIAVDTVVAHSGGAPLLKIATEHLRSKGGEVRGVHFNGQLAPKGDGISGVRTAEDWVTVNMDGLLYGPWSPFSGAHTVGPGAHGIDEFEPYRNLTLREAEKSQRDRRLDDIQGQAPKLKKEFECDGAPPDEAITEAEQFVLELQKEQDAARRHQKIEEGIILGAKVGCAVASGFERWQQEQEGSQVESAHKRAQEEESVFEQELRAQRGAAADSLRSYQSLSSRLDMSRWANDRITSSEQELSAHLTRLKKHVGDWKKVEGRLQRDKTEADENRKAVLEREISRDKKMITRILSGLSGFCDIAKMAATGSPSIAAGIGFAGSAFSAGAAYTNREVTAEELRREEEARAFQHQAALHEAGAESAGARREFHENRRLEALERISGSDQSPPSIRGVALAEQLHHWEQKKEAHASRKEGAKHASEKLAWQEEMDHLSEKVRCCRAAVDRSEAIKDIEDRGWKIKKYWGRFWSPSDDATRAFAKALDDQVRLYAEVHGDEHHALYSTFAAFEELAGVMGDRRFQRIVSGGRDLYTMADISRYAWSTAIPNLFAASEGPGTWMENIGGVRKLLTAYLGPMVQFVSCGYHIAQLLTETDLSEPKGVIRTRQLRHLSEQLDRLHGSVSAMNRQLYEQRVAVDRGFSLTLDSIAHLRGRIDRRVEALERQFRAGTDEATYDAETRERVGTLGKLGGSLGTKSFEDAIALLHSAARRAEDVDQSGVILTESPGPLEPPNYTPFLYKQPSHHTRTLCGLVLDEDRPLANLSQYLKIVSLFLQTAQRRVGSDDRESVQLRQKLLAQGRQLRDLMGLYNQACQQAADAQEALLVALRDRGDAVLRAEESRRLGVVKQRARRLRRGTLTHLVGMSRFGLTIAFVNTFKPGAAPPSRAALLAQAVTLYTPKRDAFGRGAREVGEKGAEAAAWTIGTGGASGAGAMIGAASVDGVALSMLAGGASEAGILGLMVASSAAMAAAATAAAVTVTGAAVTVTGAAVATGNGARRIWNASDWQEVLASEHAILSGPSLLPSQHLQWHFATDSRLADLVVNSISFRAAQDLPYRTVWVATPSRKYEIFTRGASLLVNPSLLTSAEAALLPRFWGKSGHKELVENFLTVAMSQTPAGSFDQDFLDGSVWIPAADRTHIPLAFPKSLLGPFEQEKRKLAAKGLTLTPKYAFAIDPRQCELSLEFFVGGQLHISVVVASFDYSCVKTFGAPMVDDSGLKHDTLNYNEFLITALYTSFQQDVGFPGKDSVEIARLNLVAPVDLPFPGIYKLLDREKGKMISFTLAGMLEVRSMARRICNLLGMLLISVDRDLRMKPSMKSTASAFGFSKR